MDEHVSFTILGIHVMRRCPQLLLPLAFSLLMASVVAASGRSFSICGTGDSLLLFTNLAEYYMAAHPDLSIKVPESTGSTGGLHQVKEGDCELGRVARELTKEEKSGTISYRHLAYSPVVFITNANVPVKTISTKQVIGVFSGQINNWRELGGQDAIIYVATRECGDSCRTVLESSITPLQSLELWAGKTLYTTDETIATIKRHKDTISFAPLAMVQGNGVRALYYNGIAPSAENVKSGKYPLTVNLGLIWEGTLPPYIQNFVDFIFSKQGREIITKTGAIPSQ